MKSLEKEFYFGALGSLIVFSPMGHFWHFENSTSHIRWNSCNYNNYQIINPIIIPYAFDKKYWWTIL
jgi:hypothetical protein